MELTSTITQGFTPFRDGKEHTLKPCDKCYAPVKATHTNGPAVATNDNITGAYFLNLWLCRPCYDHLDLQRHLTDNRIGIQ